MRQSQKDASTAKRALAGAIAGVAGGLAHAATNEIDRKIFAYDADDMLMVTGMFMEDKSKARRLGVVIHLGLAMAFGASYAVVLHPKGKRDAVIKGIGAGLIENTILWPLVVPLDRLHPYIRDGRIDSFNHPISLVQASLRHIALGLGLGVTYPRILGRSC